MLAVGRGWGAPKQTAGRTYVFEGVQSKDVPVLSILRSNTDNGRELHSCAIANGKMYVISGINSVGGSASTKYANLIYDIATDTWDSGANIPTVKVGAACASYYDASGKQIISLSGGAASQGDTAATTNYKYDPTTDTWSTLATNGYAVVYASCAAIGIYVYVIGGTNLHTSPAIGYVRKYNTRTDTWSSMSSISLARQFATATAVGKYIYVFGGSTTFSGLATNVAYRYDTELDTWSTLDPMPEVRTRHASAAIGKKIYVFGGVSGTYGNGTATDTIYCYDTETEKWSLLPYTMPGVAMNMSAETYDDKIYLYGGKLGIQASSQSSSMHTLVFSIDREPSFEILGENKLLFDKDVLVDDEVIPANTETTLTVESATVTFPEVTSGTIEPIGEIVIN